MEILGIDIGGSGIKGAPVDVANGTLTQPRYRIPTPNPSTPQAVAEVVGQLVRHFDWRGPVGCTFPAVVRHGIVYSAANVDKAWIGTDGEALLREATGQPVRLLNDADAAGVAEMQLGAGRGKGGVVMVLTFGTGIGSGLFVDGRLVPNAELGHLELNGREAEAWASDRAREAEDLKWRVWAERVDTYLIHLDRLFSPELFIIGGGVSKHHEKFIPRLSLQERIVPAALRNEAGIVGAALAAQALDGG